MKKNIFLLLLLWVNPGISIGQFQTSPSDIDSLRNNLNRIQEDSLHIVTLLNLAGAYTTQDPDSSIYYAVKAKNLSRKINKPLYFAHALGVIGWSNYLMGNYSIALWNYNKALSITQALGKKAPHELKYQAVKFRAALFGNIGVVYSEQADYPKALSNFFKSLKISQEIGDKKETARHFGNIGNVYFYQSEYRKALAYFLKAIKIAHELGYKQLEANTLCNVGVIFRNQANDECSKGNISYALEKIYPESVTYFKKSLKLAEELGYKHLQAVSLDNLGLVYSDQIQYLCMNQENKSSKENATTTSFIESCDSLQNKAMNFYISALKIDEELGNISGTVMHLGNIGSLLVNSGKFAEGEKYLKRSIAISDTLDDLESLKEYNYILSHLYDTLANLQGLAKHVAGQNLEGLKPQTDYYKLAYIHFKKYTTAKDSIFNEEKAKDIGRIETRHELEMAELKRQQEEKDVALAMAVALSRRNTLEYSGILMGIFALFVMVFFIGKFNLPPWAVELSVFIPFLILFEFILVFMDPYIESITGGEPVWKLLVNAILAGIIFPIHAFFEKMMKSRIHKPASIN